MNQIFVAIARILISLACVLAAFGAVPAAAQTAASSASCLACHDGTKDLKMAGAGGKARAVHPVKPDALAAGVHAKLQCNDCHKDVVDNQAPHKKTAAPAPDCLACHQKLWDEAKAAGQDKARPAMGLVITQAESHRLSIHSKPNADDPTHPNA